MGYIFGIANERRLLTMSLDFELNLRKTLCNCRLEILVNLSTSVIMNLHIVHVTTSEKKKKNIKS